MATSKQIFKIIKTKNQKIAWRFFKKYNNPNFFDKFATIVKQKGDNKNFTYIVTVYTFTK